MRIMNLMGSGNTAMLGSISEADSHKDSTRDVIK